jgi:hypothetical protein
MVQFCVECDVLQTFLDMGTGSAFIIDKDKNVNPSTTKLMFEAKPKSSWAFPRLLLGFKMGRDLQFYTMCFTIARKDPKQDPRWSRNGTEMIAAWLQDGPWQEGHNPIYVSLCVPQDGLKMGPRRAQHGPRCPQDGPEIGQDGPKMCPRWAKDGPPRALPLPNELLSMKPSHTQRPLVSPRVAVLPVIRQPNARPETALFPSPNASPF